MSITSLTNVTMGNLTDIGNFTTPFDFYVNLNNIVYGGVYWFIMLWVAYIILFAVSQLVRDQPLNNAMLAGASITIIALMLRVVGLLNDHQFWAFPILTIILAAVAWGLKD